MLKAILLAAVLATTGCRSYYYVKTDPMTGAKQELWIQTLLSDASLAGLDLMVGTNSVLHVEGYTQQVNEEAIKAIVEGVVTGVGKAIVPLP